MDHVGTRETPKPAVLWRWPGDSRPLGWYPARVQCAPTHASLQHSSRDKNTDRERFVGIITTTIILRGNVSIISAPGLVAFHKTILEEYKRIAATAERKGRCD